MARADAILSVVLKKLADIEEEKIRSEFSLVGSVKKEVLELSGQLNTVRDVLEDADRRGVKENSVRDWLTKLEDTAYEMDEILDEWNYHAIGASPKEEKVCCSFIPSSCLFFKKVAVWRDIAKKIKNVKASLDEVLKEKDEFNFLLSMPTIDSATGIQSLSLIDVGKVEGHDIEWNKNVIMRKLMYDSNAKFVSIVGMGGIGKTTLARLVYNDSRIKDCFQFTIWICVSDPFDVAEVARRIIEIVEKKSPPVTNELEVILQMLRYSISGKKFLLVLDDVWLEERNKWEPLKIILNHGAESSKIMMTTRLVRTATMMGTFEEIYYPKLLSEEESWSLLRRRICLLGKEGHGEFEDVGNNLAKKSKGLPLAVNILGSVLQFKNSLEEWENLLKSEIWLLTESEGLLYSHLLLSYKELSPPLKLCFSYCAVYPRDFEIEVESLIQQWMTLGYLGSVNENSEEVGRDYFKNLAMRSLFQDFKTDDSEGQIRSCKMHDILYDFAQFINKNAREDSFRMRRLFQEGNSCEVSHVQEYHSMFCEKGFSPKFCDCLASLRFLGFNCRSTNVSLQGIEKLIHLRWLDASETCLSKKDVEVICKLYLLQTLLLRDCSLKEIPREIGKMVHLRHLDLSENEGLEDLPKSMCNLVELVKLLLSSCSLKEIPHEIGNLVRLRHFDLSHNRELKVLPDSMCSLIELQTLLLSGCCLKEIPCKIGNLVQLRRLDLSRNGELKELPQSMYSLIKLQTFLLRECSLEQISSGIGNLIHLRHLDLSHNCELKKLEKMSNLAELQTLDIEYCMNLRVEGLSFLSGLTSLNGFLGGSGCNKFGSLENLINLSELSILVSCSNSSIDMKELVEDARKACLKEKTHLRTLEIKFKFFRQRVEEGFSKFKFMCQRVEEESISSSPLSLPSLWVELIEALKPDENLECLKILHYKGSRLPDWISSPLNLVREIELWDCSELLSLPPMGKLPNLEKLYMRKMDKLEALGVEWLGIRERKGGVMLDIPSSSLVVAFPKLKELKFEHCRKWMKWEDITVEEEESTAMSVMPCLTDLYVSSCNALEILPHHLLRKASSLQLLCIRSSSLLIDGYVNQTDDSPWRFIFEKHPQLYVSHRHFCDECGLKHI